MDSDPATHSPSPPPTGELFPENPVLTRVWRGSEVESQHRGAWVLTDGSGRVLAGVGSFERSYFARSSIKCLQALPLLESGAADAIGYTPLELGLALASHNGEALHTDTVTGVLERLALGSDALLCGPQNPSDPEARSGLVHKGEKASALHNNCSGKHAGFLTLTRHLGAPPEEYLEPDSPTQQLVRAAIFEMCDVKAGDVPRAVDGCSAPTYKLPLSGIATAFARVANPARLGSASRQEACQRMLAAVAAHPDAIAGKHKRICTDLARVTGGRIFPKVGGEAIYAIGIQGRDMGLAVKVDDGSYRGFHALLVDLLDRFGLLEEGERKQLAAWDAGPIKNWSGREVGHVEVVA